MFYFDSNTTVPLECVVLVTINGSAVTCRLVYSETPLTGLPVYEFLQIRPTFNISLVCLIKFSNPFRILLYLMTTYLRSSKFKNVLQVCFCLHQLLFNESSLILHEATVVSLVKVCFAISVN